MGWGGVGFPLAYGEEATRPQAPSRSREEGPGTPHSLPKHCRQSAKEAAGSRELPEISPSKQGGSRQALQFFLSSSSSDKGEHD